MISLIHPHYRRAKALYRRYERVLIPGMLVFGFVVDYITFKTIQVHIALTVLACYFALAGALIAFTRFYDAGRISHRFRFVRLLAPLGIQYTFGALLGASFVFYWFSANVAASWPFILILAGLMVGNEALRKHIQRHSVQLSIYYVISFSFFSIALPYLANDLGPKLFLLAGLASLGYMYAYVRLVSMARDDFWAARGFVLKTVFAIFIGMNALYFANIIPPVPLALREAGAYHQVRRETGGYALYREKENLFQRLLPGRDVRLAPGDRLYVYTAIFAPGDLNTRIYHQWHYYNEQTNNWETRDRLSFAITGGRAEGYRGYSVKSAAEPGKWRVTVETGRGQSLGRITFGVEQVKKTPELEIIKAD